MSHSCEINDHRNFPYRFYDLDSELNGKLKRDFKGIQLLQYEKVRNNFLLLSGVRDGFIQVGPKKWFLPRTYKKHASSIYNLKVRPNDVWLITYPRSGKFHQAANKENFSFFLEEQQLRKRCCG